jgi:hypothetical protein
MWFALSEDRPLFAFAGLRTSWRGVRGPKSAPVEAQHELFGFLTTEANAIVAPIHPKAMPVILTTPGEVDQWLTARTRDALTLQRPLPDDALRIVAAEDGAAFFNVACEHGLEGIVSKRVDRPYRSGKSGEWLKTKCVQTASFIVIGYQPDDRGRVANLKLAIEEKGALRYAGTVGTGWNESSALALKKRLDAIAVPRASVAGINAKGAVWTMPALRVEIAYRGLTATGELRAASFKGLLEEQ